MDDLYLCDTIWWSSQINRELTLLQNVIEGKKKGHGGYEILFEKLLGIVSIWSNLVTLQKEIYWWYWVRHILKTLLQCEVVFGFGDFFSVNWVSNHWECLKVVKTPTSLEVIFD